MNILFDFISLLKQKCILAYIPALVVFIRIMYLIFSRVVVVKVSNYIIISPWNLILFSLRE